MLTDNGKNLYGVYWTSGISAQLLGIYDASNYDASNGDVLQQFADDYNCTDFAEFIDDIILKQNGAELDDCKTTDEYDKLYNELFENEAACYSVHPVEISIKH